MAVLHVSPVRVECIRLIPVLWIAVDGINRDGNGYIFCEVHTIQNAVFIASSEGAEVKTGYIKPYYFGCN